MLISVRSGIPPDACPQAGLSKSLFPEHLLQLRWSVLVCLFRLRLFPSGVLLSYKRKMPSVCFQSLFLLLWLAIKKRGVSKSSADAFDAPPFGTDQSGKLKCLLALMSVLSQSLFTLVRSHLMSLFFLSVWHSFNFLFVKIYCLLKFSFCSCRVLPPFISLWRSSSPR